MSEQKFLKYFIFDDKKDLKLPPYRVPTDPDLVKRITHVDEDTIEGATFYNEMMWILPGFGKDYTGDAPNFFEEHTHNFGVLMSFYVLNYFMNKDIKAARKKYHLGAEIEFTIDGEAHIITESFTAFIPPGVKHGPLTIRNVTRPIAHMIA
ncbi:hypothetical protein ACFL6W_10330, partial [Thermodesulfobacteriota bacterium]